MYNQSHSDHAIAPVSHVCLLAQVAIRYIETKDETPPRMRHNHSPCTPCRSSLPTAHITLCNQG